MAHDRTTEATPVGDPARSTSDNARRRLDPGRRKLAGAVAMIIIGSFMPWISTALGNVSGARGAGLWTFYAAMVGLAGVLLPARRWAGIQAALLAAVAVGLPAWQLMHVYGLVGLGGWLPGPGLVLVLGGGVLSGVAAYRLLRD